MIEIIHADCRDAMLDLLIEGRRVHSIITDPPYNLKSIVKRFGAKNAAPAKHGRDGAFARVGRGFMGKEWDGTEITFDPEVWKLCYRLLRPGGFLCAFSSPRTGHRMACAIEDAGFIIHPFIGWLYGNGLTKPHSVAKVGPEWEGWYHSTQAMKPALEPIYLAQKPFSEKTGAANVEKHQTGALNIDACRVARDDDTARPSGVNKGVYGADDRRGMIRGGHENGGWPSNLCHDGSFEEPEFRIFNSFPPVIYHRKANKAERIGDHPTQKPPGLLQHLTRLTTIKGGTVLDPFAGTGTILDAALAEGCNAILIEKELEYVRDIRRRQTRAMI